MINRIIIQDLNDSQVRNFREKIVSRCGEFIKTVQQLEDKARKKGNNDIVNESLTLCSQIRYVVNKAERQLNCSKEDIQTIRMRVNGISRLYKVLQFKMECLKRKLATDGLSNEMKDLLEKICVLHRVNKSIQNMDDDLQLQRYYRILYRMLINHFVAFKLMSKEQNQQGLKACELGDDSLVGYICSSLTGIYGNEFLQSIITVPFDILNTYRSIKPSQLSENIAFKLRDQVSQQQLTLGIAQLIEELLANQDYNSTISKIIHTNYEKYLGLLCVKIAGRRVSLEEVFKIQMRTYEKLAILHSTEILQILYAAEEYQVRVAFQDNKWSQLIGSLLTVQSNVQEIVAEEQVIPRVEQIREVDQSPSSYVISNTGGGYKLPKRQQQPQHQLWWCWCLPTSNCLRLYCSCQGCTCAIWCFKYCNATCRLCNCGLSPQVCEIWLRSICHF